jgi:hypothetical protein
VLYPIELRAHDPNPDGRGRGIRTPDILLPKQARYQTALYPAEPGHSRRVLRADHELSSMHQLSVNEKKYHRPAFLTTQLAARPLQIFRGAFSASKTSGRVKRPELIAIGAPGEIRTPDPQVRSLVLYPTELRARARSESMKVHTFIVNP